MATSVKPQAMANDALFALSMYFSASLKAHLLAYNEDVWTLVLLGGVFVLQLKADAAWAAAHAAAKPPPPLFVGVLTEAVRLVTRTLAFLLLQVAIHLVTGHATGSTGLWHEAVVLPCLLLLLGMVVVTVTKTFAAATAL